MISLFILQTYEKVENSNYLAKRRPSLRHEVQSSGKHLTKGNYDSGTHYVNLNKVSHNNSRRPNMKSPDMKLQKNAYKSGMTSLPKVLI